MKMPGEVDKGAIEQTIYAMHGKDGSDTKGMCFADKWPCKNRNRKGMCEGCILLNGKKTNFVPK